MIENGQLGRTLDIFKLPSQVRIVFGVIVGGIFLSTGVVVAASTLGAINAYRWEVVMVPGSVIGSFAALALTGVQSAVIPLLLGATLLQVWLRPAWVNRRLHSTDLAGVDLDMKKRFQQLIRKAGYSGDPKIVTSDAKVDAQAYGAWRPHIFISRPMLRTLTREEQDAVILHEVAHFLNRDVFPLEFSSALLWSLAISIVVLLIVVFGAFWGWAWDLISLYSRGLDTSEVITGALRQFVSVFWVLSTLVLSALVLLVANPVLRVLRERLADLRVRSLNPGGFGKLVLLVSRGVRRRGFVERLLEHGSDGWSRRDSILDPRRLFRPSIFFIAVFGFLQGLLAAVSVRSVEIVEIYTHASNVSESQGSLFNIYGEYQFFAAWFIAYGVLGFINITWLLVGGLSYSIVIPFSKPSVILQPIIWITKAMFALAIGQLIAFLLLSGGSLFSGLVPVGVFISNYPAALAVFFLAWVVQQSLLSAHSLVGEIRTHTTVWLILVPILYALSLGLILTKGGALRWAFDIPAIVDFEALMAISPFSSEYWTVLFTALPEITSRYTWFPGNLGARLLVIAAAYYIFLFIPLSFLDFFEACRVCRRKVEFGFEIGMKCPHCASPLGDWISTHPSPMQEPSFGVTNSPALVAGMSLGQASLAVAKKAFVSIATLTILIALAAMFYRLHSNPWLVQRMGGWLLRAGALLVAFFIAVGVVISALDAVYSRLGLTEPDDDQDN